MLDAGYQLHSDYTLLFNADNHLRTDEIIFALALDNEHTCAYGATTLLVCGSVLGGSTMQPANYGVSSAWSMFRARGAFANLFTYGGSSLVAFTILVFVAFALDASTRKGLPVYGIRR